MDIITAIIIVILVFVIGFILSRPFLDAEQQQTSPQTYPHYQNQYQDLLADIKSTQDLYPDADIPGEVSAQLEEKKREAARILRLINEEKTKSN